MSFTNSTTNYGLPQWIAADKPKFLTDINNAYDTIDTQLKNANDNANTASNNAASALSIAGQAATTAESAATVAGQAAALAQSVNELVGTLNAKMGTTSIATVGDGTVTGAIYDINSNISKNILGARVDLSLYTSSQDSYTTPSDGYVYVSCAADNTGLLCIGSSSGVVLGGAAGRYGCMVRKGMVLYCSGVPTTVAFIPLS